MKKILVTLACVLALVGVAAGASTASTVGGEGGGLKLEDPCLPAQWQMTGLCWSVAMQKMVHCMCRRFLVCGVYIYVWAELIDPVKQKAPYKPVKDYVYL